MADILEEPGNIPRIDQIIAEHEKSKYDHSLRGRIITILVVALTGFIPLSLLFVSDITKS
ncbi:MAG: hypothetical protein ACOC2L_05305 [Candidatus Sumerlaeota bacterium]